MIKKMFCRVFKSLFILPNMSNIRQNTKNISKGRKNGKRGSLGRTPGFALAMQNHWNLRISNAKIISVSHCYSAVFPVSHSWCENAQLGQIDSFSVRFRILDAKLGIPHANTSNDLFFMPPTHSEPRKIRFPPFLRHFHLQDHVTNMDLLPKS